MQTASDIQSELQNALALLPVEFLHHKVSGGGCVFVKDKGHVCGDFVIGFGEAGDVPDGNCGDAIGEIGGQGDVDFRVVLAAIAEQDYL